MCGDKVWPLGDRKTVSLIFLGSFGSQNGLSNLSDLSNRIGMEGRRILNSKNPHIMIDVLSTAEFRKIVEAAFIRPRNITFDRDVFLTMKQLRGKAVKHFYGKHKELAENCVFQNNEETLMRDVFITNLIDLEIQKDLLKHRVEPRQVLELKKNMELGMRNEHQIQQHNKPVIPASVNAIQFPPSS